jgi:hypothetical protein
MFITSKGNEVKVMFKKNGDNNFTLVFYVNDKLADDAPKTGLDKEILSGVIYVIREFAKHNKINEIDFSAFSGEGDRKVLKNIDIKPPLKKMNDKLKELESIVRDYEVKFSPMSPKVKEILTRQGKKVSDNVPDLKKDEVLETINTLKKLEGSEKDLSKLHDADRELSFTLKVLKDKHEDLIDDVAESIRNVIRAIDSHQEGGTIVRKNKRDSVYKKLIDRSLKDLFSVKKQSGTFVLTREETSPARKKLTVYHGTNKRFSRFNLEKTTQRIIWFNSDKDKILNGDVGAQGNGYIVTAEVTINNPAGWDEYDKLGLYDLDKRQ